MTAAGQRRQGSDRPKGPTNKPKLNALQRYQRGRKIAEMRSRPKPVAWTEIAKVVGMTSKGAQFAYTAFLDAEETAHDGAQAVDDTIDVLTVALADAVANMEAAPLGSSARTGAERQVINAALQRLSVMRAAGRAPRSLAAPSIEQQVQVLFRQFTELLRRHAVGDEVIREFVELAERQMRGPADVEGRVLPSAA